MSGMWGKTLVLTRNRYIIILILKAVSALHTPMLFLQM